MTASVFLHPSLEGNNTAIGYAKELSDYLNRVSLSGRIGKDGGFERNAQATSSGVMKIHIKIPGEGFWSSSLRQSLRTSDNYLVYAMHWDDPGKFMVIAIITPDAHARIDGLLPSIIKITEKDFHSLTMSDFKVLKFY